MFKTRLQISSKGTSRICGRSLTLASMLLFLLRIWGPLCGFICSSSCYILPLYLCHVLHCLLVALIQCSRVMLSAFYPFLHKFRWLCSTLSVFKALSWKLRCFPSPYGYKYFIILIHLVSFNTWKLFSSSTENNLFYLVAEVWWHRI